MFIPRVELGQNNINKTVYKITLRRATSKGQIVEGSANVMYRPEDDTAKLPAPPLTAQDFSSNYYYVYNYQHFIRLVNDAFVAALFDLRYKTITTAGGTAAWVNAAAPYLEWDHNTCVASLYSEATTYIYFNSRLYELFVGMPAHFIEAQGYVNYKLRTTKVEGLTESKVKSAKVYTYDSDILQDVNYVNTYQEISSIAMWNPIASIVFATSLLPIQPTQTSSPEDIGTSKNNLSDGGGNNANLTNILSDFVIPVSASNQYRPVIDYSPSSEYRLIDMNSCMNMNRVDVMVYWKDHFGNLNPMVLPPGCAAHVKLLFRRKDFNVIC